MPSDGEFRPAWSPFEEAADSFPESSTMQRRYAAAAFRLLAARLLGRVRLLLFFLWAVIGALELAGLFALLGWSELFLSLSLLVIVWTGALIQRFVPGTIIKILRNAKRTVDRTQSILVLRSFLPDHSRMARNVLTPTLQCFGRLRIVRDPSYETSNPDEPHIDLVPGLLDEEGEDYADHLHNYRDVANLTDWMTGVRRLLDEVDIVVIDVSHVSAYMLWESELALMRLAAERVLLVARRGTDSEVAREFARASPSRVILYDASFFGQLRFAFSLLRSMRRVQASPRELDTTLHVEATLEYVGLEPTEDRIAELEQLLELVSAAGETSRATLAWLFRAALYDPDSAAPTLQTFDVDMPAKPSDWVSWDTEAKRRFVFDHVVGKMREWETVEDVWERYHWTAPWDLSLDELRGEIAASLERRMEDVPEITEDLLSRAESHPELAPYLPTSHEFAAFMLVSLATYSSDLQSLENLKMLGVGVPQRPVDWALRTTLEKSRFLFDFAVRELKHWKDAGDAYRAPAGQWAPEARPPRDTIALAMESAGIRERGLTDEIASLLERSARVYWWMDLDECANRFLTGVLDVSAGTLGSLGIRLEGGSWHDAQVTVQERRRRIFTAALDVLRSWREDSDLGWVDDNTWVEPMLNERPPSYYIEPALRRAEIVPDEPVLREWEARIAALGQRLGHTPSEAAWIFRRAITDLSDNAIAFLGISARDFGEGSDWDDSSRRRMLLDRLAEEYPATQSASGVRCADGIAGHR